MSHVTRAFRPSVGLSPHVWPVRRRVALAKVMMRAQDRLLAEIALACGFAREEDMSPGRWRRMAEPQIRTPVLDAVPA